MKLHVDYSRIGYADTFETPLFSWERAELEVGDRVLVVGDAVADRYAVVRQIHDGGAVLEFETSLTPA